MTSYSLVLLVLFSVLKFRLFNCYDKINGIVFDSYLHMTSIEDYPDVCKNYESEVCANSWLKEIDIIKKRNNNRLENAKFSCSTNINEECNKMVIEMSNQYSKAYQKFIDKLRKFKWQTFHDSRIRRIFGLLAPNIKSKNESITSTMLNVSESMKYIYNHGRPCFGYCLEEGENGIVELFIKETNYDKLAGFWTAWRNETGRKVKDFYFQRMQLENLGAKENGYSDAKSFYLQNDFERLNFNETALNLYEEILPLYKQLHGYVRYCLSKFYPNRFDVKGPIPAHILGNVWAQQWQNILPILQKCRGKNSSDNIPKEVNKNLRKLTVKEMFKIAEEFYVSIGLYKMTPYFWKRSVFEQKKTLMDCHGSASDFSNKVDFRISMCTTKTLNDFSTVHHEMGHIEYFMAYRELPEIFQESANSGFHEAIGDTIALSVNTPEHLERIGLLDSVPTSKEFDIDYLLAIALEKVAFLPFALAMDSYSWSVSNGSVPYSHLNSAWWDRIYRFQGLMPPGKRTEDDFDAGAKYHITFDVSYIRYFVSFIVQFQFYESMCKLSDYSGTLHRCDFYESKEAGRKLLEMLSKGRSQHWKYSLEILTGVREISTKSMLRYFEPLHDWLREINEKLNVPIGW